jgi:hypothetical protein
MKVSFAFSEVHCRPNVCFSIPYHTQVRTSGVKTFNIVSDSSLKMFCVIKFHSQQNLLYILP